MRVRADSESVRTSLRAFAADLAANAERAVSTAAKVGEGAAKATEAWKDGEESNPDGSPRRHGVHTRDTIEGKSRGFRGWVEVGGAGRFLNDGTRAHDIAPRKGKFLRFWQNGSGPYFRRIVHHPGTRPTHFLDAAALEAALFLRWKLRALVGEAKRRYGFR